MFRYLPNEWRTAVFWPSNRCCDFVFGDFIFGFFRRTHNVLGKEGTLGGVYDVTAWFRVMSLILLALGATLLVGEIRRWSASESEREQSNAGFFGPLRLRLLKDGPLWLIFNLSQIALGAYMGFKMQASISSDVSSSIGLLCIGLLVTVTVFVIGVVSQASAQLRAPSLSRFSLNWGGDPLQVLFIATLATLALIVGGAFRVGIRGLWTLAPYVSILGALLIGQAVVYGAFRDRFKRNGKTRGGGNAPSGIH